ncbi:MAG: hypothetical protein P8Z40_00195, partial [Chloroflexota bacterium]
MNKKYLYILIAGLITTLMLVVAPSAIARAACTTAPDGSITCTGDDDTVTINAGESPPNVSGGAGNDQIDNHGNVSGTIQGDAGDDTINNDGVAGNLSGGPGTNTGNDTINNSGTVQNNIYGYDGNNTINNLP